MSAILAIAHDTLLMLCRRRLFWLNVWLSVLVVLVVASMSCQSSGWSLGFGLKSWPSTYLVHNSPWEITLFHGVVRRALQWWVAGISPLLALFSMASVIPKTLKSGSAALLFPQSRGRAEVLLGRFTGGVLVAAIPSLICVTGLFLTLGWRIGLWEPRLFLALPFMWLMFAVLSSVTVMLGVLTKSSSASLVVTLILAASVTALQDAASRTGDPEKSGGPGPSGGLIALQSIAWPLPRTKELMDGMDQAIGLPSPRMFRDLVRRWRIGNVRVGAAAAEVLDAKTDSPPPEVTPVEFSEAVIVTTAFTCLILGIAAMLLKRRDL